MNRRAALIIACSAAALALAACGKSDAPKAKPVDPHAKIQTDMEKGMSFKRIIIVRLQSEGKRIDVTTLVPAEVAVATVKGEVAKTLIRVNEAEDGLIFFSRDVLKGTSYRTEVKFTDLEKKKAVVFPVLQPDGSLKERDFALEKIAIPE